MTPYSCSFSITNILEIYWLAYLAFFNTGVSRIPIKEWGVTLPWKYFFQQSHVTTFGQKRSISSIVQQDKLLKKTENLL